MTTIHVHAELRYSIMTDTSFAFSVVAARTAHQEVEDETITVEPVVPYRLVPYGAGTHQLLRFDAAPGELEVCYDARVRVEAQISEPSTLRERPFGEVPADVLPYLNPSRYCESDKLGDFAYRTFGELELGYGRVKAVSDWVGANLVYAAGTTDGSSSTADVLLQRAGVCRDFAHVGISLCRALGIPARYVTGYGIGVEPQDFHGFFEAYLDDDWYLFDPTGMAAANGLVRIGYGRDAADAPFATLVGQAELTDKIVTVEAVGTLPAEPPAASTA